METVDGSGRAACIALVLCWSAGCGDSGTAADAATDAGGTDAATEADGSSDGRVDVDAGPPPRGCLGRYDPEACGTSEDCGGGRVCLRGVCVAECGASADALEPGLGAGLEVLGGHCAPSHDGSAVRVRDDAGCEVATVYYVDAYHDGPDRLGWQLRSFEVNPFAREVEADELASGVVERPGSGDENVLDTPIAVAPDGSSVLFVVRDALTNSSTLYRVLLPSGTLVEESSNFGPPVFLDPEHVVAPDVIDHGSYVEFGLDVLTLGESEHLSAWLGSNGATSLGSLPSAGSVLVARANDLYAVPIDEMLSVADTEGEPIDVLADTTPEPLGASFFYRVLDEEHIVVPGGDGSTERAALPVTIDGESVSVGEPIRITKEGLFSDVVGLGDGRLMLSTSGGVILVRLPE